ncbi:hypothetical protein STCU_07811 [Strigomonas culicis]|uniref:SAM domain-containing protein n=1 Tax=Strigomonas culicis TaxID=28005 RepID=S9U366_9TRYP|nr:hypothetical protein STCU_07811 [Strigomonas culicis]|eukprot:EPY23229.1 hypothetical protein STCU_07811 [Strigomonas culicis]
MDHWTPLLLRRVVREALLTEAAPAPLTEEAVEELVAWARDGALGGVAAALTRAALSLPPTAEQAPPAAAAAADSKAAESGAEWAGTVEANRAELEGAQGVQLMRSVFEKRGLKGIAHVLERENIDLGVFLAMTESDFRTVFKATFGISKKLQSLQRELKANLK